MNSIDKNNLVTKLGQYQIEVKELLTEKYSSFDALLSFYGIIMDINPTYIAPIYHLDNYIRLLDDPYASGLFLEKQKRIEHSYLRIEFQDTLISIRNLLDRIVKLIGIQYPEISKFSTFGYFNEKTQESKGFMRFIFMQKDHNELFEYIFNEYNSWIKRAIGSRNKVIHYNDLPIIYRTTIDHEKPFQEFASTIIHLNKNLNESVNIDNNEEVDKIAFDKDDLENYVANTYEFFNITVENLIKKYK